MELHPAEVELLLKIRNKYQWGKITLECRNGLPSRIEKVTEFEKLD